MPDQKTTWDRFHDTVNMTARELERWLGTEESKGVGQKQGGGEATGHASGRRIVGILKAKRADLTDADYAHMRKVVGYAEPPRRARSGVPYADGHRSHRG